MAADDSLRKFHNTDLMCSSSTRPAPKDVQWSSHEAHACSNRSNLPGTDEYNAAAASTNPPKTTEQYQCCGFKVVSLQPRQAAAVLPAALLFSGPIIGRRQEQPQKILESTESVEEIRSSRASNEHAGI